MKTFTRQVHVYLTIEAKDGEAASRAACDATTLMLAQDGVQQIRGAPGALVDSINAGIVAICDERGKVRTLTVSSVDEDVA